MPTNINIYYYVYDPRNAYLNGMDYQLTDCDGTTLGGFLLPAVPEPSTLALLAVAASVLASVFRRSR